MVNVILYTRVSTSEQADNGFSLQHQKSALERYCEIKKYNIIQHFEEDFSAKTFHRPKWKILKEYIKQNKKNVDLILCLKWDRFSRNQTDALIEIRDLRDNYGVEVNTSEQPLDLSQSESKLLLAVYLASPEIENDKNSQRTTVGSRQARLEGCWTGTAPLGYNHIRNAAGKSTLSPNNFAPLIQRVFYEFSKGIYSAEELRKKMSSEGLKRSKMAFLDLLRNVVYIGKIKIKAWEKNDSMDVEGLHDGLIEESMFQKVQQILTGRKKNKVSIKSKVVEQLPLRGLIKCKNCGGNLTGSPSKGGSNKYYYYYHCNNSKCKERFRADYANSAFENYLSNLYFPREIVDLYGGICEDVYNSQSGEAKNKIEEIEKRIEALKIQAEKIEDLFINERITDAEYRAMKQRYEKQLNDSMMEHAELGVSNKNSINQLRFGISMVKDLPLFYSKASLEGKRSIISSIFPEKLVFEKDSYRTTRINEVIALLQRSVNTFGGWQKENVDKNADVSCKAPPARLERATL